MSDNPISARQVRDDDGRGRRLQMLGEVRQGKNHYIYLGDDDRYNKSRNTVWVKDENHGDYELQDFRALRNSLGGTSGHRKWGWARRR